MIPMQYSEGKNNTRVDGAIQKKNSLISSFDCSFGFLPIRKNALDKARSMVNHIAYPDELLDEKKLIEFYEPVGYMYLVVVLVISGVTERGFGGSKCSPDGKRKFLVFFCYTKPIFWLRHCLPTVPKFS